MNKPNLVGSYAGVIILEQRDCGSTDVDIKFCTRPSGFRLGNGSVKLVAQWCQLPRYLLRCMCVIVVEKRQEL